MELTESVELRQYIAIVWRHLWLILLAAALAGGTALVVSLLSPPIYQATTTLEIDQGGGDPREDPYTALRTSERVAMTYLEQIQTRALLEEVVEQLNLQMSAGQLKEMITVEHVRDTQLIRISVESSDPALAKALAETIAQVFTEQEMDKQQARFQAGLDELEAQLAQVEVSIEETQRQIVSLGDPADPENTRMPEFVRFEQTRLTSKLTNDQIRLTMLLRSAEDFRMAMARYTDYISVFSPANLPTAPIRPRTIMNTLLGTVVGAMLGVGAVFLLEYLDDTVKSPDDIKQNLPVGVLGMVPLLDETDDQTSSLIVNDSPLHPVAEAFRNLRTSIRFSGVDEPVRTLLVTSPEPSSGKTFTAANLAVAIAQGGQTVVMVDADLRRPMLHRLFGLPKEPGLTSVLLRPEERDTVLRQTGIKGLQIITSGSRAPNPAELLASNRFRDLISSLAEEADAVIIDSPPVLAVTDAAVLSTLADGTLLIVDCGETRKPAAAEAVQRLTDVGGRVLGVVLNRMTRSAGTYYYYDYSYSEDSDTGRDKKGDNWISRLLKRGRRSDVLSLSKKGRRRRSRSPRGQKVEVQA